MNLDALIPLSAIIFGCMIVLIPITGITARFALKPVLEALAKFREGKGNEETVALLERRVALLEEHLNSLDRNVGALADEAAFRRQLESGAAPLPQIKARESAQV